MTSLHSSDELHPSEATTNSSNSNSPNLSDRKFRNSEALASIHGNPEAEALLESVKRQLEKMMISVAVEGTSARETQAFVNSNLESDYQEVIAKKIAEAEQRATESRAQFDELIAQIENSDVGIANNFKAKRETLEAKYEIDTALAKLASNALDKKMDRYTKKVLTETVA